MLTIPFWKPLLGIILGLEHWMEHCKPLWFLPCLMLTEWIFYLLHRMSKKNEKILLGYVTLTTLLGFLLSQLNTPPLPWGIGGSCSMMLFISLDIYSVLKIILIYYKKQINIIIPLLFGGVSV